MYVSYNIIKTLFASSSFSATKHGGLKPDD